MLDHPMRTANPIAEIIREIAPFLDMENGPWVAGGAGRLLAEDQTEIGLSDVDLFFQNKEMFDWAVAYMLSCSKKNNTMMDDEFQDHFWSCEVSNATPASEQFIIKVQEKLYTFQLVKKEWYSSVETLMDSFDFTITMFATDGHTLVCDPRALDDLKTRTLVLHKQPIKPKAARLAKYCSHGFAPGPGVALAMLGVNSDKFPFVSSDLKYDEY